MNPRHSDSCRELIPDVWCLVAGSWFTGIGPYLGRGTGGCAVDSGYTARESSGRPLIKGSLGRGGNGEASSLVEGCRSEVEGGVLTVRSPGRKQCTLSCESP